MLGGHAKAGGPASRKAAMSGAPEAAPVLLRWSGALLWFALATLAGSMTARGDEPEGHARFQGDTVQEPCPAGMILVEGSYVPSAGHHCIAWISEAKDRCARYAPPALLGGAPEPKRFCIDRFEYPNLEGVRPAVMASFHDAREACEVEGKRLCTSSEWTLACEGNEVRPYPYGYERDAEACNIDRPRPAPEPDFEAFGHPRRWGAEVTRLDLRVKSGEQPRCKSPFGVHDMTGNVDEWTVNDRHFEAPAEGKSRPFVSALKGGYWGPIRARCRPITESHNEWFRFYQVGFRCCGEAPPGSPTRPPVGASTTGPLSRTAGVR